MNSSATIGENKQIFKNRGIIYGTGALLLITGIALLVLGGMKVLGPLEGVGAISCMTIGGVDTLLMLLIGLKAAYHKIANANKVIIGASNELKETVYWHCSQESSRVVLPSYRSEKELCCDKWKNFEPKPEDKLIIVIYIDPYTAYSTNGEKKSPPYEVVTQFQESMGKHLLVLLDVRDANKNHEPKEMLGQEPIWQTLFSNNQVITTRELSWKTQIQNFMSKST